MKIIVVSHVAGYAGPNTEELTDENRIAIESGGGKVLTTSARFCRGKSRHQEEDGNIPAE